MGRDELLSLYESDKDIHDYVERYRNCWRNSASVEDALSHKMVQNYIDYVLELRKDADTTTDITVKQ